MLRTPLVNAFRASQRASFATAATAAKKTTSTTVKKTATKASTAKAPPPPPIEEPVAIPEEALIDPPEFNLQVGQSQRSSEPITTTSALGNKKLDDLFKMSLHDLPPQGSAQNDIHWPTSFFGLGAAPFSESAQQVLAQPIDPLDIEIKPDGLIYLPEIKYRRILNKAFGAGGWGLVPRSETMVTSTLVTREYALVAMGRLVSIARGEQDYFSADGIPTATEGCRSNALMRCCKDLGIASELWDPNFIRSFKSKYCEDKFVEHATTKRKRKIWKRKDRGVDYPYKLT